MERENDLVCKCGSRDFFPSHLKAKRRTCRACHSESCRARQRKNWEARLVSHAKEHAVFLERRRLKKKNTRKLILTGHRKKCKGCLKSKDLAHFFKDSSSPDGRQRLCKECDQGRVADQNRAAWQQTLIYRSRNNAKRSMTGRLRLKPRDHSITAEDVRIQYEKQNGRCHWFGIKMDPTNGDAQNYRKVSLDRRDSELGYTKENIVLCSQAANFAKGSQKPEDFIRLMADVVENFSYAPCHTLLSDPARFLTTPPESDPPPDGLAAPPLDTPES